MKKKIKPWLLNKWDEYGYSIILYIVMLGAGLLGAYGCMKCTEPTHHDYPYHNIESGKGQYEYGGSKEQEDDINNADQYMTEDEKARETEYERQVERELREMENW